MGSGVLLSLPQNPLQPVAVAFCASRLPNPKDLQLHFIVLPTVVVLLVVTWLR